MNKQKRIGYVMAYSEGHNNYGTSLQGYALLRKMQQFGYDVEIIYYVKQLSFRQKISYVVNAIKAKETRMLTRQLSSIYNRKVHSAYYECLKYRTLAVNAYKEKKLKPFFHRYVGFDKLREGSKGYDLIIVGSDQVWMPLSLPNKFFNLLFAVDEVKKVAYASSFGVSEIPKFQRKATGEYLDRFSKIGVREQKGKEIVESLSTMTATVVADPTLLFTKDEWDSEIYQTISNTTLSNITRANGKPYIFCYLISPNEEARKQSKELSRRTGLPIITIRHMEQYRAIDEKIGDEVPYSVDPNDFVRYISHASYVCTDSFHCTVFSIIYHRQFITFYRTKNMNKSSRNSRIESLFNVLGIGKEHIYQGDMNSINEPINWDLVECNLSKLREDSITFLRNALQ